VVFNPLLLGFIFFIKQRFLAYIATGTIYWPHWEFRILEWKLKRFVSN